MANCRGPRGLVAARAAPAAARSARSPLTFYLLPASLLSPFFCVLPLSFFLHSLVPQLPPGIRPRRSSGGHVARAERGNGERDSHCEKRRRVGRGHAEQQRRQRAAGGQSAGGADAESERG